MHVCNQHFLNIGTNGVSRRPAIIKKATNFSLGDGTPIFGAWAVLLFSGVWLVDLLEAILLAGGASPVTDSLLIQDLLSMISLMASLYQGLASDAVSMTGLVSTAQIDPSFPMKIFLLVFHGLLGILMERL
jgi:hypothetical protein